MVLAALGLGRLMFFIWLPRTAGCKPNLIFCIVISFLKVGWLTQPNPKSSSELEVKQRNGYSSNMQKIMTIGDIAKRSGVAASALRFYEERGLIKSQRTGSGHRRYPSSVLRRIAFIVFAQRVGLSLDEVAIELARLPQGSTPSAQDWSKLSKTWSERIDQRIAELERLKSSLSECIGCGCLSLEHCQMVNPEDRAAGFGPGPLRWRSTDNA